MHRITGFGVWTVAVVAGALMVGAPAAAQVGSPVERDDRRERDCVCVRDMGDRMLRQVRVATRHARIGVALGEREEVAGRYGVRVASVPEDSPAHRAGLREGDIIMAVEGRDLGSNPGAALIERLGAVTPGDPVDVRYVRDGEERTARVLTEEGNIMEALADGIRFQIPAMRRVLADEDFPLRHRRGGLQLAAVNPELGAYFGTDRGVLVTAVDSDTSLNLRPGDVILAVGDREVRDPAHVRSILASYRDDETIPLRIVREQRTQQVTGER